MPNTTRREISDPVIADIRARAEREVMVNRFKPENRARIGRPTGVVIKNFKRKRGRSVPDWLESWTSQRAEKPEK